MCSQRMLCGKTLAVSVWDGKSVFMRDVYSNEKRSL